MIVNSINSTVREILERDIFEYLNLNSLSDREKAELIENLIVSLQNRVMLRIADLLEESHEFEIFKALLDKESVLDEEVIEFLKARNIQVDILTAEEAILLKSEILALDKVPQGGQVA